MTVTVKGTTFVNAGLPAAANGALTLTRVPTSAFRRERLDESIPAPVARVIYQLQENLHEVSSSVQSLPESGPRTYFKDVAFTSGVGKVLAHLMGVAASAANAFAPSASPVVSDPTQIRFEVLNQRTAAGSCYRQAIDARTITLVPNATFTGDVRLFVIP